MGRQNKELMEYIKEEIKITREFFKDDEHYDEVFEQAGWDEDNMRIFDVGLIRGLEYVLNKLQEYGETE
tara:strand:- start:198 stop:404 length:207 start_codon:yes stop_codon:yes gene_type:complete